MVRHNSTVLRHMFRIALFLLPVVLAVGYLEVRLHAIPTSYAAKDTLAKTSPDTVILALGSSYGFFGLNAGSWPVRGINLANASQSLWYDKEILHKYLPYLPNVKIVVLPLSYFSLWYDLSTNATESFRQFFYFRYMGLLPSKPTTMIDIRNYSLISLYTPPTVFNLIQNNFVLNTTVDMDSDGNNRPAYTLYEDMNYTEAYNKVSMLSGMMSDQWYGPNTGYVREIADICRKRGIALVLVVLPVTDYFTGEADPAKFTETVRFMDGLADQKTVFSKSYLSDTRFTVDDFFDTDHLNAFGADKMSAILYTDVFQPILEADR
jgi:hypothetical protein